MVTPAGKEMLKNTINTVKLHNRILEENEMWRHWYMEKGLTMMVSDDLFRKDKTLSAIIEREKRKSRKKKKHREKHKKNKHEGKESRRCSKSVVTKVINSSADRWDHSGFEELYPETKAEVKNDDLSDVKRNLSTKKHKQSSSSTSRSTDSDSSDSREIWEEFKLFKKRKRKEDLEDKVSKHKRYDSDSDQGSCKKHKGSERTSKKKKCEGRHCHHKHEKKKTKHKHS